jgi:dTDP-4-amino-4,6-dideoxygalactose transaminase
MSKKNLPFALPDIDFNEINEVVDTLKSGWLTSGPKVKIFESNFQKFIGGNTHAIAVNSATSGLHLALEALGVSAEDEVIIPTLTFTATAEVVRYLNADIKFVDIDPITLNININDIKKAITSKSKAIILVHYAGLSCDMDPILALAREFNLKIIEDAAHALSAEYKGIAVGALQSDITVFSFYANKTITTGEGGMIITRNNKLANRMRIMRLHGIDRDVYNRFQSEKPSWYYQVIEPGFKYNMTDISAAIGIHQLKKLPSFLKRRQYLANRYHKLLANLPLTLPWEGASTGIHSWHLYVIRVKSNAKLNRDELIDFLANAGIGTSVHYTPLHRQPYWKNRYKLSNEAFPVSEKAYSTMLSIPLYTAMSDNDQDLVIENLHKALE